MGRTRQPKIMFSPIRTALLGASRSLVGLALQGQILAAGASP